MTAVAISKTAKPPIPVAKYVRNGKSPDAALQALLAERVGQGALLRTKQVFSRSTPFVLLPDKAPKDGSQPRWRFAWHSGPFCKTLAIMLTLAPAFPAATTPHGKLTIANASGAVVAVAKLYGGAHGELTIPPAWPDSLTIGLVSLVDPTDESTPVDLSPETDYYGTFSDEDLGRVQSACVWEVSLPPDTDNGYPASGVAVNAPIYASHRADVATALAKLWHHGGQPLWHWCSDVDENAFELEPAMGGAPHTNLADNTSTSVTSSTPGVQLDLRKRSRLALDGQVPVRMRAYVSSPGADGTVRLLDSKGVVLVEVDVVSSVEGWYTADGFLPALDAKYYLAAGGNETEPLVVYAVSLFEYSEP